MMDKVSTVWFNLDSRERAQLSASTCEVNFDSALVAKPILGAITNSRCLASGLGCIQGVSRRGRRS